MKYSYTGVFVPSGCDGISDRNFYTLERNNSIDRKLIPEVVRSDAVRNSSIDEYALRNHWTLAMGETSIINPPWNNFDELEEDIRCLSSVSKVKSKKSKTKSCVIGYIKSESVNTVKNKIKHMYGKNVPVFWGKDHFEIQTRFLWVGHSNYFFDDVEEVWNGELEY